MISITRMHSSRMPTARFSGHLGGVYLGEVSACGRCLPAGGVCPGVGGGGLVPTRGVSTWDVSAKGGVHLPLVNRMTDRWV